MILMHPTTAKNRRKKHNYFHQIRYAIRRNLHIIAVVIMHSGSERDTMLRELVEIQYGTCSYTSQVPAPRRRRHNSLHLSAD